MRLDIHVDIYIYIHTYVYRIKRMYIRHNPNPMYYITYDIYSSVCTIVYKNGHYNQSQHYGVKVSNVFIYI